MSESTYQIIIVVGMLIPVVGGALTAIFRILGWGRAASIVEALQPLALRAAHEAATKPASDKPEPPKAPPGSLIMMLSILFALLAFGCSSVAVVDGAVTAANLAAKGERMATPILDKLCAEPMTALALEPPSAERRKAFDDLTAHCDPLEGAYRQLHADREVLVDLIEAATSEEGAKVGDIIEATKKLTKSIGELAALVEEMSR